ncbi:MAG: tetratricopeptide repeat protein [Acidobacteriota bacterium]
MAFLRFWPTSEERCPLLATLNDEVLPGGMHRLEPPLIGVLPTAGRGAVVQLATRLAQYLRIKAGSAAAPGILIYPGSVATLGDRIEILPDGLSEDLAERPPKLPSGVIAMTGYASAWLAGRFLTSGIDAYQGPSGRRVALQALDGPRRPPLPFHNKRIFGRRVSLGRSDFERRLREALFSSPRGTVLLEGPLGVGKSRAAWQALGGRPSVWVDMASELPHRPSLVIRFLEQIGSPMLPKASWLEDPERAAELLLTAWRESAEASGAAPVLVVEGLEGGGAADQATAAVVLDRLRAGSGGGLPWLHIERSGRAAAGARGLDAEQTLTLDPLTAEETAEYLELFLAGLEMPPAVADRLASASAGYPLALEEGVLDMVQRGLLRRVYGSFFYAGGDGGEYQPSPRLVRHVEAALRQVGDPLPLRMLASANDAIDPEHLRFACAELGVELREGWHRHFIDHGWLRLNGDRLGFAVPAHGLALAATLGREGTRSLRHALGGVLATDGAEWTAYRLMAGSPEALPSLLDTSRDSAGAAPREELFNALWTEYREHRERGGDEATELEILWALLPLARRLGCLGRLGREVRRAVELARGDDQRFVALVALRAEHDQEQGKFRDAEAGLRAALATSVGFEEKRRATLFLRLGVLLHRQQRWSEARDIFRGLASVAEKGGPTSIGATCRFYLGNVALHQRRLDAAETHHRRALQFRRQSHMQRAVGTSLCGLGAVSIARGDFPSALRAFDEASEIFENQGVEPWEHSYSLLGSGRASIRLGDLTGGTTLLKRALEARGGRNDVIGEAYAHLEMALGYLLLEQDERALGQTRKAHFLLSLAPEGALLGDAERLLGRISLRQLEWRVAEEHLGLAQRLHAKHADEHAVAEDCSWLLELSMAADDWRGVERAVLELGRLLDALAQPDGAEALFYRLYRGLLWLRERGFGVGDPENPLRRAYKELMRKTAYLPPERRQSFLFQIRVHQDILNEATRYQISLPQVPQVLPPMDL